MLNIRKCDCVQHYTIRREIGMSEIKLRRQSSQEDRYSLHLGQQVIICGITKRDADGICSTYRRLFLSRPTDRGREQSATTNPVSRAA